MEYLYNETLNITIFDGETANVLNATCNYNDETVNPSFELLNYNSSLTNRLNCSLINYYVLDTIVIPVPSEYNLTMNKSVFEIVLIDERLNEPFDVGNLTSVIVYLDDNTSFHDFKDAGSAYVNFTSGDITRLRFELGYSSGVVITRYVDVSLVNEFPLRVCANVEGVTHFEQLMTSSGIKPVIIKNVFSNCYVAADYTRFAYQETQVLKAFTIQSIYYLFVFENDDITANNILLASIDGSIATFINLDNLEFQRTGYLIDIIGDSLTINKRNDNEMNIFYVNIDDDNTALSVRIVRLDTDELLLNTTDFSDPNEALIIFNFASLNINDTTLFQVQTVATSPSGTSTINRKFLTSGATGNLNPALIVIVTIFLAMFGLSFTSSSTTFSWFGAFIELFNVILLSFAESTWYVTFFMAIHGILFVYTILVGYGKNIAVIS